jgi:hypothetical protein
LDEINFPNPNESNPENSEDEFNLQDFDFNESPKIDQSAKLPQARTINDDMCYYLKPPSTAKLNVRVSANCPILTNERMFLRFEFICYIALNIL